jgi:hypothetical protein
VASALPPSVWAPDLNAGYGNDIAWVHFSAYAVQSADGLVLDHTNFSDWSLASDQAPARWSGVITFAQHFGSEFYVDYRIEFWSYYSDTMTGWVAERHGTYNYYNMFNEPAGTSSSCRSL